MQIIVPFMGKGLSIYIKKKKSSNGTLPNFQLGGGGGLARKGKRGPKGSKVLEKGGGGK